MLILRGLNIERETYQRLSNAGLLPPLATRTLMYEIDDEIEEAEQGALRVEAARRAHLPWYARSHRMLLGLLPPPLGEDLTKVGYIEISARRLAAQRAAAETGELQVSPEHRSAKDRRRQANVRRLGESCRLTIGAAREAGRCGTRCASPSPGASAQWNYGAGGSRGPGRYRSHLIKCGP